MSVTDQVVRESFNCNGSVVDFSFAHPFMEISDLAVWHIDADDIPTLLDHVTDYSYDLPTGIPMDGCTITTVATYANGEKILVIRDIPYTQPTNWRVYSKFMPSQINTDLDRMAMEIQQLKDKLDRVPSLHVASAVSGIELDEPVENYFLLWKSGALRSRQFLSPGNLSFEAFMEVFLESANAAAARTAIGAEVDTHNHNLADLTEKDFSSLVSKNLADMDEKDFSSLVNKNLADMDEKSYNSLTDKPLANADSGYINSNDYTNRHLGSSNLTYDNLVGTFQVGETITEATSGNIGIVVSDSGTVLVLSDVTGTGIFIDGRQITGGTSGATADVNGATKNLDANFTHNLDAPVSDLLIKVLISTDGTDANSFEILGADYAGSASAGGYTFWQIDNNNIKVQTGNNGVNYILDDGTLTAVDTEDWYYKIVVYRLR